MPKPCAGGAGPPNRDTEAQYNLGVVYAKGEGIPRDHAEAVRWYRKAARQGFVRAQNNLGFMHANGEGIPRDYTEAVFWYRKAAEQGDALAQANLGFMYANGEGVPKDKVQAYAWISMAAAQGHTPSGEVKESIAGDLTRAEIAEAQKLSSEYLEAYGSIYR